MACCTPLYISSSRCWSEHFGRIDPSQWTMHNEMFRAHNSIPAAGTQWVENVCYIANNGLTMGPPLIAHCSCSLKYKYNCKYKYKYKYNYIVNNVLTMGPPLITHCSCSLKYKYKYIYSNNVTESSLFCNCMKGFNGHDEGHPRLQTW